MDLKRLLGSVSPPPADPLSRAGITPGMWHYRHEVEGEVTRHHLRIDSDGSGLMVANAAAVALLRPSGAIIAKGLLDGEADGVIIERLLTAFRGATTEQAREDIERVRRLIATLDAPGDNYPIVNLRDPEFSSQSRPAAKPFSADLCLAAPDTLVPMLDRLWEAGFPHVTLITGAKPDRVALLRGVERAEDLGMIAGVRGRGSDLAGGTLVADLAQAGVDHVNVLYLATDEAVHDALAGPGDHRQAVESLQDVRRNEVCPVAEVALTASTLVTLEDTLDALSDMGVRNVAFFAVTAENGGPDEILSKEQLLHAADLVEDSAGRSDVRYLWYPPLVFNPVRSLAEQVQRGPRCSGQHAVRVQSDGDVIPAHGPFRAIGNLLKGTWPAAIILALALFLFAASPVGAQNYSFSVPNLKMQVWVQADASVRIEYDITFRNSEFGQAIDVVDIGVPQANYQLRSAAASIDGEALTDIRPSEYVHPGYEVHLAGKTIAPGASGTLHTEFVVPDMVWQDTTRDDYASLQITPTWFGEQFVVGTTQIDLAVHLPAGIKPDEVLHQGVEFNQKALFGDGTTVAWQWPATRLTGPHKVGVSFPKRVMNRVVKMSAIGLLVKWFEESPGVRMFFGLAFVVLFGITFFRFTGGTGLSVFVVAAALLTLLFMVRPGVHLLAMPLVVGLLVLNEWFLRKRRLDYMPPIAQVEGGGIKRGLTAPEAAVILQLPPGRILGLVIFGLLKKGVLRQIQADPLVVAVDDRFTIRDDRVLASDKERTKFLREAAAKAGVVIHRYEQPFIYRILGASQQPVHKINFAGPMKHLLLHAAERLRGFDLSDTQDYYRSIVRRAAEEARSVGEISQREKQIDRDFEWILIDDDWPTVFDRGPYRPTWTRGSFGGSGPVVPSGPTGSAPAGGTSFGDVAASFAGWMENTMGRMATALAPGSLAVDRPGGGFLDLSGADRITADVFQALSEASRQGGGGGGGGGCACACAGCACACACAGGGR